MTALEFDVLGTPAPQGSKRAFPHRTTGRVVTIESGHDKVQRWRGDVIRSAADALPGIDLGRTQTGSQPLFDGPVFVDIEFRFDRPKGHYRTGRNAHLLRDSAPTHPTGKPDIDKVLRATLDAITAAKVWRDDAQVVSVEMHKAYADQARPGATIRIITPDHVRAATTIRIAEGVL